MAPPPSNRPKVASRLAALALGVSGLLLAACGGPVSLAAPSVPHRGALAPGLLADPAGTTASATAADGLLAVASALAPVATSAAELPAAAVSGTRSSGSGVDPVPDPFYQPPSPLPPAPPGTLIRSEPIPVGPGLPAGTTAYRVLYHSESLAGTDVAVSGTVVVPGGPGPATGRPIVSWAHGTTGIAGSCAPSLQGIGSIPYLAQLLAMGAIVTATDYAGLGAPGLDPYLVGLSEARTVLDAARAARALVGSGASDAVVVLGYSQGGQAALFAGQIAPTYAPDLFLTGEVSLAPVANVTELFPPTLGNTPDPLAVYAFMTAVNWSTVYGTYPLSQVLTPEAIALAPAVDQVCASTLSTAFAGLAADKVFLPTWRRDRPLQRLAELNDAGGTPTRAPILVAQGSADPLVPAPSTAALVDGRLCGTDHDTVDYVVFPGADHGTVVQRAQSTVVRWISARLAGEPAGNSCTTNVAPS